MSDSNKVWVIDDGKRTEVTSLGEPLQPAVRPEPRPAPPRPARRPLRPASALRPAAAAPRAEQPARRPMHSALLLVLAYALGPAAVLLSRRGRRSTVLVALAAGSAAAAAALAAGWWALYAGHAGVALLPWLTFGTVLETALGFTVWARGLQLVTGGERVANHPWSPRLTGPWTAALLGLAAPGSAQVLARRPGRAAATVWGAWPFVAATVLALQAPLLWAQRASFAVWGLDATAVERLLLGAVALAALAPLLWLTQALEGARVLAARAGRWQRMRGDWCAVALAASVVAAAVVNDPATLAAGLGDYAGDLAADGLTATPLLLVRAARHLDPGQPAYALQEADLYAAAGAEARARQVRTDLDRTLQPYVGALAREERYARAAPAAPAPAARPAAAASVGPDAAGLPMTTPAAVRRPAGPPAPHPGAIADSLP